ncbi:hypothetical protein Micbo1qcDRAFT_167133, partial [Microdochium bolleyi]
MAWWSAWCAVGIADSQGSNGLMHQLSTPAIDVDSHSRDGVCADERVQNPGTRRKRTCETSTSWTCNDGKQGAAHP